MSSTGKVSKTYVRGSGPSLKSTRSEVIQSAPGKIASPEPELSSQELSCNLNSFKFCSPLKKDKASELFDELFNDDPVKADPKQSPAPKRTVSDTQLLQQSSSVVSAAKPEFSAERKNKIFTAKLKRTIIPPTKFVDDPTFNDEPPISQIKCPRQEKEMYTVVKNVRQAHLCRELGEAQEFTDDMEYYLSSILSANENNVKYLSVATLAQKCISANFRAHVRAQSFDKKLFNALSEFRPDSTLALCTACVFYLLSRDRLSLAIDAPTLRLVLKLMESEEPVDQSDADYIKYKQKMWQILSEWHRNVQSSAGLNQTVLFDVTFENLSASFLATEALVFVFLRTKNEAFKLTMCKLGGLDIVVKQYSKELDSLSDVERTLDDMHLMKLKLVERYLRILEQATHACSANQAYLTTYDSSSILKSLDKLFKFCRKLIPVVCSSSVNASTPGRKRAPTSSPSKVILDTLSSCLKVLCNLSHLNELCCIKLGEISGFLERCVELICLVIPNFLPNDDKFDLSTLTLSLLVNLVEPCNSNRRLAISAKIFYKSSPEAEPVKQQAVYSLTKLFLKHESAAQVIDEEVDKDIESCSQKQLSGNSDEVSQQLQETLDSAVQKAGRHMEDCIIASHIALFIGLMLQQNEAAAAEVKTLLGERSFQPMIAMLKKFLDFLRLINNITPSCEKTMLTAIDLLERLM